ncbi:MAG: fatty acid hydroxylase, partial [Massilia sp.]|nr:fatty acid hydroxylase [Massilia sp.]
MIDFCINLFGTLHGWLFEHVVEPVVFIGGLGEFTEEAFEGTEWFLVGMVELVALYL